MNYLEEWTGLQSSDVLFDTDVNSWSMYTALLNERIFGKKQIVFLIEDEDGEKFGYYLHTTVKEIMWEEKAFEADSESFEFNIQSKDNRLPNPMKFEIKDVKEGGYKLWLNDNDPGFLIFIGDIVLMLKNYKNCCLCSQKNENFDYHGIENALCGKTGFELKRLVVIQMK